MRYRPETDLVLKGVTLTIRYEEASTWRLPGSVESRSCPKTFPLRRTDRERGGEGVPMVPYRAQPPHRLSCPGVHGSVGWNNLALT